MKRRSGVFANSFFYGVLCMVFIVAPRSFADPILFGGYINASVALSLPLVPFYSQLLNTPLQAQTMYEVSPVNVANSSKFVEGHVLYDDTASASIAAGASNAQLSGTATAASDNGDNPDPTAGTSANGQAYLAWFDTLYVIDSALPLGTPVVIQVTNKMYSSLTLGGDYSPQVFDSLQINDGFDPGLDLLNDYTTPEVNSLIQYFYLNTYVGATLSLEEQGGIEASGSDIFNAFAGLNTTVYVDAFSVGLNSSGFAREAFENDSGVAGVTITSASGVDYSTPSGVPEPSELLLLSCGLVAIGLMGKKKVQRP